MNGEKYNNKVRCIVTYAMFCVVSMTMGFVMMGCGQSMRAIDGISSGSMEKHTHLNEDEKKIDEQVDDVEHLVGEATMACSKSDQLMGRLIDQRGYLVIDIDELQQDDDNEVSTSSFELNQGERAEPSFFWHGKNKVHTFVNNLNTIINRYADSVTEARNKMETLRQRILLEKSQLDPANPNHRGKIATLERSLEELKKAEENLNFSTEYLAQKVQLAIDKLGKIETKLSSSVGGFFAYLFILAPYIEPVKYTLEGFCQKITPTTGTGTDVGITAAVEW